MVRVETIEQRGQAFRNLVATQSTVAVGIEQP